MGRIHRVGINARVLRRVLVVDRYHGDKVHQVRNSNIIRYESTTN